MVLIAHLIGTKSFPLNFGALDHLGNYGVRVFFVISGFLITTLLLKEFASTNTISLRKFYLRRALRILPASWVYICMVCVAATAGIISLYPGDLLHAITYTMNYHNIPLAVLHGRANNWYLNHLWSLSVEEQFYLIWPVTVALFRPRWALSVAGTVILAGPIIRAAMWHSMLNLPLDVITTAVSRQFEAVSDALATGCVLAGVYNWLGARQQYQAFLRSAYSTVILLLVITAATLVYVKSIGIFWIASQSVINIALAMVVERFVRYPNGILGNLLNSRPFVFVGAISYSLYLWQEPFLNRYHDDPVTAFPLNLLMVIICSLLSYYWIELRFLKLKDRLEKKRPSQAPVSSVKPRHLCRPKD
jgi:peptidoglycan/LPS O-acetylase OafA/YrhL